MTKKDLAAQHCEEGSLALEAKNYPLAAEFYKKAMRLDPAEPAYIYNYALALRKSGKLSEAVSALKKALRMEPYDDDDYIELLARVYAQLGDKKKAIAYMKESLTLNSAAGRLNTLGIMYSKAGNNQAAIECYSVSVRLEPSSDTYDNMAGLQLDIGSYEDAIKTCRRGLRESPGDCDLQTKLITALRLNGQTRAALNLARKVVETCDKDVTSLLELGNCLSDLKQDSEAIEHFLRALELDINNDEVHNCLGVSLDKVGRYSEGEEHFRIALEAAPDDPTYHNNLGVSLDLQERYPEAEAAFQKAVALDPKNSIHRTNLEEAQTKINRN